MIAIGTRPESANHAFEKMLDGHQVTYAQVHAARKDDPPFQRRTWLKANPGLDHLPDLEETIRREAEQARKDVAALQSFQALRLNLGVSDVVQSTLLEAGTWERVEVDELPPKQGDYILGIDAGQNRAMSAAAAFWPETGRTEAFGVFPETPGLRERGLSDGVGRIYLDMYDAGELLIAGRRVTDLASLLKTTRERWGAPAALVCDTWRYPELQDKLESTNFPLCDLVLRRQGFGDGGEDRRTFVVAVLEDRVKTG